jgi:hypothetical protein
MNMLCLSSSVILNEQKAKKNKFQFKCLLFISNANKYIFDNTIISQTRKGVADIRGIIVIILILVGIRLGQYRGVCGGG